MGGRRRREQHLSSSVNGTGQKLELDEHRYDELDFRPVDQVGQRTVVVSQWTSAFALLAVLLFVLYIWCGHRRYVRQKKKVESERERRLLAAATVGADYWAKTSVHYSSLKESPGPSRCSRTAADDLVCSDGKEEEKSRTDSMFPSSSVSDAGGRRPLDSWSAAMGLAKCPSRTSVVSDFGPFAGVANTNSRAVSPTRCSSDSHLNKVCRS